MNELRSSLSKDSSHNDSIFNKIAGGGTIFYLVVKYLQVKQVEFCLKNGADPWKKNPSDGKLPLHLALENGNVPICQALYRAMGKSLEETPNQINLEKMNSSLLQKVICNVVPVEKRSKDVDHADCLDLLLHNETGSVLQVNTESPSILEFVENLPDCEEKRAIEIKADLRFFPSIAGIFFCKSIISRTHHFVCVSDLIVHYCLHILF